MLLAAFVVAFVLVLLLFAFFPWGPAEAKQKPLRKFHYGQKVIAHNSFYGTIHGTVTERMSDPDSYMVSFVKGNTNRIDWFSPEDMEPL